jgi:hypothetical protein
VSLSSFIIDIVRRNNIPTEYVVQHGSIQSSYIPYPLLGGAEVTDKNNQDSAIRGRSSKKLVPPCLGEKRHRSSKEEGEDHQNPNGIECGVRAGAECCEPVHRNDRQHEQDEDYAGDDEADEDINPRSGVEMHVSVGGLVTQLWGEEDPLWFVIKHLRRLERCNGIQSWTHPNKPAVQLQEYRLDESIKSRPFSSTVQCHKVFLVPDETLLLVNERLGIRDPVANTSVISF